MFCDSAIKKESGVGPAVASGRDEFRGEYLAVAIDEAHY